MIPTTPATVPAIDYLPIVRDAALFCLALFVLWLGCGGRSTKRRDEAALPASRDRMERLKRGKALRERGNAV